MYKLFYTLKVHAEIPGDRVYVQVPAHGMWWHENCCIASQWVPKLQAISNNMHMHRKKELYNT